MDRSSAPATFTEYWGIVLVHYNVSVRRVSDVTALSRYTRGCGACRTTRQHEIRLSEPELGRAHTMRGGRTAFGYPATTSKRQTAFQAENMGHR